MAMVWGSVWQVLRGGIDVTVDDAAIDGSTSGYRITDLTKNRPADTSNGVTEIPPGHGTVQLGFYAETPLDATGSFGCEVWMGPTWGPAVKVCDITGLAGDAWADLTQADLTTRLFYDDLTVADFSLWGDITTRGLLEDGMGIVEFTTRGMRWLFPRFYNVGDGTEADRIKALMRTF